MKPEVDLAEIISFFWTALGFIYEIASGRKVDIAELIERRSQLDESQSQLDVLFRKTDAGRSFT